MRSRIWLVGAQKEKFMERAVIVDVYPRHCQSELGHGEPQESKRQDRAKTPRPRPGRADLSTTAANTANNIGNGCFQSLFALINDRKCDPGSTAWPVACARYSIPTWKTSHQMCTIPSRVMVAQRGINAQPLQHLPTTLQPPVFHTGQRGEPICIQNK